MKHHLRTAAAYGRRLLAIAAFVLVATVLPVATAGADPSASAAAALAGEFPSSETGQGIGGQNGIDGNSPPFIGRYTSGAIATTGEIRQLEEHCESSECLLLFLDDGESAIDALVRRAIDDLESRTAAAEILQDLAANVDRYAAMLPGESEASFRADVENAQASLLAETREPGSGLRHRGLATTDAEDPQDPLDSLSDSPGLMNSGSLGLESYLTNQFNWRATHSFRYIIVTRGTASFSRYVGSIDVTYRMGLNGYEVRFSQEFHANPSGSQFVVADNVSRCRIDLSRKRDRDCAAHPRPSNGYSQWLSSLEQPAFGYESVYDSSEQRKFFEFGHDLRYRIAGHTSLYHTLWAGQSDRYTCDDDRVYRCTFD
ncbi:hypothetical protein [Candidatus Poriferisodalis sp.]|uniref:hypothetical protein n=1 Tax=Candidatus Poriferisodalis sp. TaxID=3101277 RepID=UPI003B5CB9F7